MGNVPDGREAVAGLGRAPDLHVVGLAVPEDVADLLAGDERGGRAADVARLEPVALGRLEVDRDLDLGHVVLELDVLLDDAVDAAHQVLDVVRGGRAASSRSSPKIFTTMRLARAGEHLADPLLQVGLHVAAKARVAVDHLLDRGEGLVVVGRLGRR